MTHARLTIIVPVLNEAARLPALLSQLNAAACKAVVVDGGSTDGTREGLRAAGDHVQITQSPRGRARQMNAGAVLADTPFVLFLHADTALPADGPKLAMDALASGDSCWGRFDISFDEPTALLRVVARCMNQRSALTGICTGDQALFSTLEAFNRAGRFSEIPLMEDIDLCRRLKRLGRPVRLRTPVVTAARRWRANGTLRTVATMWWLRFGYWLGIPPERLVKWYDHAR